MSFGASEFQPIEAIFQKTRKRVETHIRRAPGVPSPCHFGYAHEELAGVEYYLFLDERRRCTHASSALCSSLGLSLAELVQNRFDDLQPSDLEINEIGWREFLESGYREHLVVFRSRTGDVLGFRSQSRRLADGCLLSKLFLVT